MKNNTDSQDTSIENNERFELRATSQPNAEVLGKFATRETADVALKAKLDELAATSSARSPGELPIIADMGARPGVTSQSAAREAGKTAEQKAQEAAVAADAAKITTDHRAQGYNVPATR